MQFEVNVAPVGAWTVVAVAGDLDVATAPRLRAEVHALLAADHRPSPAPRGRSGPRLVLDLEAVDFLDSTGLGVLIGVLRRLTMAGGELRLVCSTPRLIEVFTVVGLDRVFDLRPSVADAVDAELQPAAEPGD